MFVRILILRRVKKRCNLGFSAHLHVSHQTIGTFLQAMFCGFRPTIWPDLQLPVIADVPE